MSLSFCELLFRTAGALVLYLSIELMATAHADAPLQVFKTYCFDCHDGTDAEGDLDLAGRLKQDEFDGNLIFENLATEKMPPADSEPLPLAQRRLLLTWLAERHKQVPPSPFRRINRAEFVHAVGDLLGIELDVVNKIPDDRGTRDFDSDRRIELTSEVLGTYFAVADEMLDFAFPENGFPNEKSWVTNKLRDSHETYNIYVRDYKYGVLFSWTRANNGNSYSFFYDNFETPVSGWYRLTFDAAKVGEFREDVSIQVHAGKYYYADDRPQPQRLLDVISIGSRDVKPYTITAFLQRGECVSVHCYSKHTFRQKNPQQGAYIQQLIIRGPVQDQWPPQSMQTVFANLPVKGKPKRQHGSQLDLALTDASSYQSNLRKIGGSVLVSSFQQGMEQEKMQDGSNKTFWHTRFQPTLAEPPHFVILENPGGVEIEGLSYATWSGGNGNGQVEKFSIFVSDDGDDWGESIVDGELEIRLANEQQISFPKETTKRFIKFLITEAFSLDGRSLASIGKLDVVVSQDRAHQKSKVSVDSSSPEDLKEVIRRFAERAFSSRLSDAELEPYFSAGLEGLRKHGDFVRAAKVGLKAIICSSRFLLTPGQHRSSSHATAAALARMLWLSIPDDQLRRAADSGFSERSLRRQIDRLLKDQRSDRMVQSFTDQWLNLRSWDKVSPSLKLYPRYDDLLHHYLPLETRAYLSHLIRDNLTVEHLIDSDYTFLNQRLAQHYGIKGVYGQQLRKVSFGTGIPRGGLLTMGSILKITTDGFDTSPILRGAWISKNIVGTPISPPPENVKSIESDHGQSAVTLREQIEQHKAGTTCYACHKSIDPYGFALESFDATGRWREKYRVQEPHQGTFQFRLQGYFREAGEIDSTGEIDDEEFADVFGLKKLLRSRRRRIGYNVAKKIFEYANGYTPNLKQRVALLAMLDADPVQCRMKDLMSDVIVYSLTVAREHE